MNRLEAPNRLGESDAYKRFKKRMDDASSRAYAKYKREKHGEDFIDVSCPKCGNRFTAEYVVISRPTTRYIKCPRCNMIIEVVV